MFKQLSEKQLSINELNESVEQMHDKTKDGGSPKKNYEIEPSVDILKSVYIKNTCFKIYNNDLMEEEMMP